MIDSQKFTQGGADLYIRLAYSELGKNVLVFFTSCFSGCILLQNGVFEHPSLLNTLWQLVSNPA